MRNLAGYSPWSRKELDTTEQRASNYKQRWWRRGLRTIAKTKCCFILIWECFKMKQSCTQKKYEDLVGFGVTALNISRTSLESDYLSQVLKKVKSYLISFLHCKGKVNFNFKPEFLHWGHRNVISQVLRAELWDSLLLLDSNGDTKSLTAEITQRNHLIGLSWLWNCDFFLHWLKGESITNLPSPLPISLVCLALGWGWGGTQGKHQESKLCPNV